MLELDVETLHPLIDRYMSEILDEIKTNWKYNDVVEKFVNQLFALDKTILYSVLERYTPEIAYIAEKHDSYGGLN
jgi:ATP-dependent helicase/DNAse subunit B